MSLVSIVIPTWNAEEYLRACLQSIEAQTHQDLQVLIVDDESSDASGFIADQFQQKDDRFQHIWQENRGPGPGGGRNGGLPFVAGDWIFFLDADDLIPPDAIASLVAVGDRTGSDIVTGHVGRFRTGREAWPTPNHSRSHHEQAERTHILKRPILAYDTTAWNKLYRTSFWNGANRTFPERKLFEDINPITRAHCESASTDVIRDQVYLWRIREDQTSITQQIADPRTFGDKIEQMTLAHEYLCDNGYTDVRAVFEEKSLTRDFAQGVDDVAHADDEYVKLVCTAGADFLDRMMPSSLDELPLQDQLKYHLVREGRVDDLRDMVTGAYTSAARKVKPVGEPGPAVINEFAAGLRPSVPEALTVADGSPALELSRVFVRWGDEDDLVIAATATIPGLGGRFGRLEELYVRCRQPTRTIDLPVQGVPLTSDGARGVVAALQPDRKRRRVRFAPFGRFEARVPLAMLELGNGVEASEWRFSIGGRVRGIERRTPLPRLNDDRLPAERELLVGDHIYELSVTNHVNLTVRRAPWS